jgi:hypothetical protein
MNQGPRVGSLTKKFKVKNLVILSLQERIMSPSFCLRILNLPRSTGFLNIFLSLKLSSY